MSALPGRAWRGIERFADGPRAGPALVGAALLVYGLVSYALPLAAGRDLARYLLVYGQLFDADVVFPRLHPEACADGVLTMDFVDGVREDALEAGGVSVPRVVEAGMRAVSRMIFLHGFVHADLHPGNMRFLPPGRVALFDLGLVGRIDDVDRVTTARMLFAFATGDGATVARIFHDSSPLARPPDYAGYEGEMVEFVGALQRRGLGNVQLALEIGRLFDILRRHRIQARSHMTMVNLALMTAEGLGKRLAPELSLTQASLPYLMEALAEAGAPVRAHRS